MKFQFKQAVHLNGKNYPCGFCSVSPETQGHSFFKKLLKVKLVIPVEDKAAPKQVNLSDLPEHQKKLVEKVTKKLQKASEEEGPSSVEKGNELGAPEAPDSVPPIEEKKPSAPIEDDEDENPKHPNKKRK